MSSNVDDDIRKHTKKRLLLLVFMLIVFVVTSTIVVLLFFPGVTYDVTCNVHETLGKRTNYDQLSTKTRYETARQTLEQLRNRQPTDAGQSLPEDFSLDTMQQVHDKLITESCSPILFFFVGRHAARTCETNEARNYTYVAERVRGLMNNATQCRDNFKPFIDWTSPFRADQPELITEAGRDEEIGLAKRFALLFPDILSVNNTKNIFFYTTEKIRAIQTAALFLSAIGLQNQIQNCSLPKINMSDPMYNGQMLENDPCLKKMMEHASGNLQFNDQCLLLRGTYVEQTLEQKITLHKNFTNRILKQISDRISDNFGISISGNDAKALFKVCSFERAMKSHSDSIWCSLFLQKELEYLDFQSDLDHFFKYGHKANPKHERAACPVVKDLFNQIAEVKQEKEHSLRKGVLYFSHSQDIMGLYRSLGMFEDMKNIYGSKSEQFKLEKSRTWRASLITPFSANTAFITYRCSNNGTTKYKQVVTASEVPVKMRGCHSVACDIEDFLRSIRWAETCELKQICEPDQ